MTRPSSGPSPEASDLRHWEFGRATLDEASLELRVNNRLVSIQRKPLKVLMHLLHHAGEVVTKDELIAAAWPGRIVSETVLAKAVGKLRDALSDESQEVIKTVHGYGYRFAAKVAITHKAAGATNAHFSFKPGDHPPGRHLWSLLQRLGTGGQGEAWLASHDKTRQQRVFKFAIDQASLAALKREITLFRFLNDSLGEQARVVTLRDWNLEQPPYFLESDYVAGGNLMEWAERSGGLSAIPLRARLEIAAQIAEAVAAVHSVGVLHKDLKPANVLVDTTGGAPRALLVDFGSGGMLDSRRLERLGITRMGFTKSTTALLEGTAGTPLYLAPELLAGQPPTVKGDVYALGVMLYQLVIGEFRRAMSAGWERNVDDELLRECIADAAQGDAAHRLGDAGSLAERLRTLDHARDQRRADVEAKRRAEELERALALAKSSQAAADFLSTDMFSVVGSRPLRDLTVLELLRAAAEKLSDRFGDMPLAAAQVRVALGNAFWRMECMEEARGQLDKALAHFDDLGMAGSERALPVAGQLMTVESILGRTIVLDRYDRVLEEGCRNLGPQHASVLTLSQHIAWTRFGRGEWQRAAADLQRVVHDATNGSADAVLDTAPIQLGRALISLGEYASAVTVLQGARVRLTERYGADHLTVAQTQGSLALALIRQCRFAEAENELSQAEECLTKWTAHDAAVQLVSIRYIRAQLRLAERKASEAVEILKSVLSVLEPLAWMRQSGLVGEAQTWLAAAYLATGALDLAVSSAQAAVSMSESTCGPQHPQTQAAQIGLAEIILTRGDVDEARSTLASVDRNVLAALGAKHPLQADLARLESLIARGSAGLAQAG